jgi:AcrR family transcriptional regulator
VRPDAFKSTIDYLVSFKLNSQMEHTLARTPPRRPDRRRVKTRAALLQAGRALLASRDIDGISIDEIVATADVAKGSFYNHFADKEQFARQIGAAVRRQAEEAVSVANLGISDPGARLARGLCVFLRFAIDHRDSAKVLWRLNPGSTMADAPINASLRQDLARGIRARRFSAVDVEAGLLLVMGLVVISMRHVLEERVATPAASIATSMAAAMLRALGLANAEAQDIAESASQNAFPT